MTNYQWFEVWVDDGGPDVPYILVLCADEKESAYDVHDPKLARIVHTATSYADAMYWLTEDEFSKVDGRKVF